jgi:hypothetical protein
MSDSMTKYNHRMTAEESITNFIEYLEQSAPVSSANKEWLYKKGFEIFDTYYIDEVAQVNLATQEDKDHLMAYFSSVQDTLGKMFAHIMLIEFKLHLLTQQ